MVCSFHVQLWLSVDNIAFQQPMKSMSGYHSNNWTFQHANYTNTIHQGERTSVACTAPIFSSCVPYSDNSSGHTNTHTHTDRERERMKASEVHT